MNNKRIIRVEYNWRSVNFIGEGNDYNDVVVHSYEVGLRGVSSIELILTGGSDFHIVTFIDGRATAVYNANKVFYEGYNDGTFFPGYGYYDMLEGVN